jgi:hypothetical protein
MPQAHIDIMSLLQHMDIAFAAPADAEMPVPSPYGLRFETWRSRKIEANILALFFGTTVPLIAAILSLAISLEGVGLPIPYGIGITCLVVAAVARVLWRVIRPSLQLCVIFHRDHLQIGRGLAKCVFPYEEVEIVYVQSAPVVAFKCCGTIVSVWLTDTDRLICNMALRQTCRNASYVVCGTERYLLPTDPTDPRITLEGLAGYHRRRALGAGLGMCYFAWLAIMAIWGLTQWQMGNMLLKAALEQVLVDALVGTVLITFGGIAWRQWRAARTIRGRLVDVETIEELARGTSPNGISNDSSSRTDGGL